MPVIKSPYSGRTHFVPDYDTDDFILPNAKTQEKQSHDEFNNNALTKPNWNMNKFSTRVDEYRDIPLSKEKVEQMAHKWKKQRTPRSWYNY